MTLGFATLQSQLYESLSKLLKFSVYIIHHAYLDYIHLLHYNIKRYIYHKTSNFPPLLLFKPRPDRSRPISPRESSQAASISHQSFANIPSISINQSSVSQSFANTPSICFYHLRIGFHPDKSATAADAPYCCRALFTCCGREALTCISLTSASSSSS